MRREDLDTRRRRAAYRANHRGTKEMDWIVGRYATEVLPGLNGEALERFEQFLNLPDPELHQWFHAPELAADGNFAELIASLRRFNRLE